MLGEIDGKLWAAVFAFRSSLRRIISYGMRASVVLTMSSNVFFSPSFSQRASMTKGHPSDSVCLIDRFSIQRMVSAPVTFPNYLWVVS